ncbi:MAG: sulfotransferase, partial [Sphingomonadales bacterium]
MNQIYKKPKILLIAGSGRSGSTLLDQLLGCINGFVSTGEIRWLFDAGYEANQLCSCRNPIRKCPFWSKVMKEVLQENTLKEILSLKRSVDQQRYLFRILFPALRSNKYQTSYEEHGKIYLKLFKSIQNISGARVIVDSSKHVCYASILTHNPGIDLRIVHLVRDSRAVAYSWLRKKKIEAVYWENKFMPQPKSVVSAIKWMGINTLTARHKNLGNHYLMVRYEDLIIKPKSVLKKIAKFVGEENINFDFLTNKSGIKVKKNHIALGNPNLFSNNPINLRLDNEWEKELK